MAPILYAEICLICTVIVGLCIYWSTQGSSNSASKRWLYIMLVGFGVSFVSNFLFTLFYRILSPAPCTLWTSWALKTLCHAAMCFGVFAWCGYVDTECRGLLFKTRRQMLLPILPLAALLALAVSNLWTHGLFEIGENGYVRHGLFHLEMGMLVAFTTVFSVELLAQSRRETDPIKRSHMRLMATFPLSLLLAWALTRAGEELPVMCVAITIELLCLYMGSFTQQISIDKLTQVNNRQNLLGFMKYKLVNHDERLFLFMMDLDHFKTINDSYGHLEGDDALVRAAKALKIACGDFRRRPYISRYGGDEFIVVVDSTQAEADALLERIHESLARLNAQARRPYQLTFSIGVAEYQPGMSANDLIAAADAALYKVKHARPEPAALH